MRKLLPLLLLLAACGARTPLRVPDAGPEAGCDCDCSDGQCFLTTHGCGLYETCNAGRCVPICNPATCASCAFVNVCPGFEPEHLCQ